MKINKLLLALHPPKYSITKGCTKCFWFVINGQTLIGYTFCYNSCQKIKFEK